jgi:hypothetical protein
MLDVQSRLLLHSPRLLWIVSPGTRLEDAKLQH